MYGNTLSASCDVTATRPSIVERLKQEREKAAEHIQKLDAAIEELESNPGIARIVDAVQSIGGY